VLATLFIVNSLALGFIASSQHQSRSVLDQIAPVAPASTPAATDKAPETPSAPQVPLAK
jgi:preprotein translocase subunit SecG